MSAVVSVHGLGRRFSGRPVLQAVDLEFRSGEVHALLGPNGAGKTTLVRCLTGALQPSEGTLRIDGRPVVLTGPRDAHARGLGMVHQHFTVIDALDVAENLALAQPTFLDRRRSRRARALRCMERFELHLDPDRRVADLSVGEKQRLEILRALTFARRLLVLDEPTASLGPDETAALFGQLRRLREKGLALVLITHKLREVEAVADRVSVLRDGRCVLSGPRAEISPDALERCLRGELPAAGASPPPRAGEGGEELLRLEGWRGEGFQPLDLSLRAGRILGVAGVDGNGQSELAESLVGLRPGRGRRTLHGRWGFVSGDRRGTGLALDLPIAENVLLHRALLPRPWCAKGRMEREATGLLEPFHLSTRDPWLAVRALSGGNQQRVVLARELGAKPAILVAENPTRGLDLAATESVRRALRAVAAAGGAVLLLSTDLDEVLELSHEIRVADRGRLLPTDGTRAQVESCMAGRR